MSAISKIKVGGTTYDIAYPVGSIYLSVNETSPAELFGGTWEQIKDSFLLAAGDTYTAGSTGGEARHTLTVDEMPRHFHYITKQDGFPNNDYPDTPTFIKGDMGDGTIANCNETEANRYYWTSVTTAIGGNKTHNNMPPYLAVYMWKRIA